MAGLPNHMGKINATDKGSRPASPGTKKKQTNGVSSACLENTTFFFLGGGGRLDWISGFFEPFSMFSIISRLNWKGMKWFFSWGLYNMWLIVLYCVCLLVFSILCSACILCIPWSISRTKQWEAKPLREQRAFPQLAHAIISQNFMCHSFFKTTSVTQSFNKRGLNSYI